MGKNFTLQVSLEGSLAKSGEIILVNSPKIIIFIDMCTSSLAAQPKLVVGLPSYACGPAY